jgi:Rrf2 family transcriptional regulator, iron-sulfur cluster assembly transcription factor
MRKDSYALSTPASLFSRTAEHALRAVLYLGGRPEGELVPAGRIATALGTPPNYTAKTLRQLARRGLLRSVRGPSGGFELRVHPQSLPIARVVDAVDEARVDESVCLLGDHICDSSQPCIAHRRWADLQNRVQELMEGTSVGDLLASPSGAPSRSDDGTTARQEVTLS